MARKYVNYAKLRGLLFEALAEHEKDAKSKNEEISISFDKDYKVFEECDPIRVACRIVRALADPFAKFDALMRTHYSNVKYSAIIIPGPDPETVRVFANIPLDPWDSINDLQMCAPYVYGPILLKSFSETVIADLADPRKSKAWDGTKRIINRLKRSEVMPLGRALTRYTDLQTTRGLKDSQIRDLADAIIDTRKPMELLYADEPHQFLDMYSNGPESCMSWNSLSRHAKFLLENETHPCAFFAYHPHTRGVYVKKRTKDGPTVVARCIIYQKSDGRWYNGRIYTTGSDSIRDKFKQNLRANNIHELDGRYERNVKFEIPGIPVTKDATDYALPVPYFDNLSGNINATWDESTKTFGITISTRGEANVDMGSTSGYTTRNTIIVSKCSCCGRRISGGRSRYSHQQTNDIYCSDTCVRRSGNLFMSRSDGQMVVRTPDSDTVRDAFNNDMAYTNMAAALAMRCRPARRHVTMLDEQEGVSANGAQVTDIDGTAVMLHYDMYHTARHNSLINGRDRITFDPVTAISIDVNRVASMTYNTDLPVVVDTNKMAVPANFEVLGDPTKYFSLCDDGSVNEWANDDLVFAAFFQQVPRLVQRAA